MFRKSKVLIFSQLCRKYATKVDLDAAVKENIQANLYKPRKNPGATRIKTVTVPPDIQNAVNLIIQDTGAKSLYQDSIKLNNFFFSRLLPPEESQIQEKAAKIHESVSKKYDLKLKDRILSAEEQEDHNKKIQTSTFNILKNKVYRWGNVDYDKATCLQYLMARAAPEYAALVRILDDIVKKFPDYKPRSFFDFGSGIGTGTWAVNHFWPKDIFEYFCVDTSSHMNDLARLILCHGKENVELPFKAYYQRQFLPASSDLQYSIVLSAYTLFEMPDMKSRLETIQKLWNKTEDYLIIVERGTNAGFQIVNEAREFVLDLQKGKNDGYAFAPCPHDSICPRYLEHETPCNFIIKYETMSFAGKKDIKAELFSYVILKKGVRPADDPQWPRVVRAPIVRSKHTICRLCTSQGDLKEIIFSKGKYDQATYRCARSCNWGDLLPVK